jgi:hypothetical protein
LGVVGGCGLRVRPGAGGCRRWRLRWRALAGYFSEAFGIGVWVGGIRGYGAQVGRAQVVVADQLELGLVWLFWAHAGIGGRLADGLA